MTKTICLASALLLTVAACGSSDGRQEFVSGTEPGPGIAGPSGDLGDGQPVDPEQTDECQKMDIVFVIDDSGSMQEEQTNLAANFPKFVQVLDQFRTKSGSKVDYRLAVTTTGRDLNYTITLPGFPSIPFSEKGDNGAFRNTPSCGATKRWVDKSDANATQTFACLAKTGTGGSSIEMPLYALKLAMQDRVADGTNAGFLRDDALLAVVILTDEDDCSREDNDFSIENDRCDTMPNTRPVGTYVTMLDAVAKGPGRWAAAVIAGETKCASNFGEAIEAKRLKEFVGLAGKNGAFSSICDGDLSKGLETALATFDAACKSFPPVR